MRKNKSRLVVRNIMLVVLVILLTPAVVTAGPILFSGQFDPVFGEVRLRGGDGWFDSTGAPVSVTLFGSDQGIGGSILTTVGWDVTSADADLRFLWIYQTLDVAGRAWRDVAGYFQGFPNGSGGWIWSLTQLSSNVGPALQSGWVTGVSVNPGERFGFYVLSDNDDGRASLTIYTPEPATAALGAVGLAALALVAFRRRRATDR